MAETKKEKFVRIAEARTNKIIDMIKLLGNCSNKAVYDYSKEDIKADLTDGYLTISAARKEESKQTPESGKYIRRECYYGQMQRSFYVGDQIEHEDIHAGFENGILKLTVAKKEAKPQVEQKKYIPIEG